MDSKKNLIKELEQHSGIIFDFDGTLYKLRVNWDGLKKEMERVMLTEFNDGVEFSPMSLVLHALREQSHLGYQRMIQLCEQYEREGFEKGYPNKSLIDFIKRYKGKKMAIFTMNTMATIQFFLNTYNIADAIDTVISKEVMMKPKPQGDDLTGLINTWGLPKSRVIIIGNHASDKQSGELAGIHTKIIKI